MTARKAPSESYGDRELRVLQAYRAKVIADPTSHPDHAAEAHRLLIAPSIADVSGYVSTLDLTQSIALRAVLRGEPIPCSCPRIVSTVEPARDPDPVALEPDPIEVAPDPEPARIEPRTSLVTTRQWVNGEEIDVPEPTEPTARRAWRDARRAFGV